MENNEKTMDKANESEVSTGEKVLGAIKGFWRKARGPIAGGLIGFALGAGVLSALGLKAAETVADAGEEEQAEPKDDVPFEEK